jgi:hypothetical protein
LGCCFTIQPTGRQTYREGVVSRHGRLARIKVSSVVHLASQCAR